MEFIDLFLAQNPWQKGKKFSIQPFIQRTVFDRLVKWLDREEITTIIGPRQAGKTTLLLKTIEYLLTEKNQPPETIYYFNFDQEAFQTEMSQPEKLFSFVQSRAQASRFWLFLDEIQRLKEPGLYLKILYDLPEKPLKMVVSGSSSLLLRAKTKEHLTGRQMVFFLFPLSFSEAAAFLGFKLPASANPALSELIHEMAVFGGYPKPFQEKNPQIKKQLLSQLYQDYVKKDIRDFAGVEKVTAFNKLTSLLAYQIGNLINKQELASSCQIDIRTINKYLEILGQTFVIHLLPPYFTNRRKEIVKAPKVYFLDNGLRNAQLNNFDQYFRRPDKGSLFENLVLIEIVKMLPADTQLRYWRTQAGAEVDFVLVRQKELIPIEAKSSLSQPRLPLGLRSFVNDYQPRSAFVISEGFSATKTYQKTKIHFLPFSRLKEVF